MTPTLKTFGTLAATAILGVAGAASLSLATQGASAATALHLYVAQNGSDTNAGTASKAPLRTIAKALTLAGDNPATIDVASGSYDAIKDSRARTATVTIRAVAGSTPRSDGLVAMRSSNLTVQGLQLGYANIMGASGITVSDATITGPIQVKASDDAVSKSIQITSSDITAPGQTCVSVRGASNAVTLDANSVHACRVGIGGVPTDAPSTTIKITNNTLDHMEADGIQFGAWNSVTIDRNTITNLKDPAGLIHNDGIQFTGLSSRVSITNNVIEHSNGQLLLIQDQYGPIDDVLVQNNVFADAAAYAIQAQGATKVRFINNTVWQSGYGGLLLRRGKQSATAPTDTVVVNNLLSGYDEIEGAAARDRAGNSVAKCPKTLLAGVRCIADPLFTSAVGKEFSLSASSPARGAGRASGAPATDITGATRRTPPSIGAYE